MYKIAEKTDLCQMSLTGMRALVLVNLLTKAPRSLEEIREAFIKCGIMEDYHSNDIIRIDLNTLRTMGCEITRAGMKTGFKYVLKNHPFSLYIQSEEVSVIKKAYKKIKASNNLKLLRKYDDLFVKLATYVYDDKVKQELYGLCTFKDYKNELIDQLLVDCENNMTLEIDYKNPVEKHKANKHIVAQKLSLQNDKLYLLGYDKDKREQVMLNVKRIKSIVSRILEKDGIQAKTTHIKFFLKSFGINDIEDGEKIVETNDKGYVVEGNYYNEFTAIQRILSFGSYCTVLEPEDIREKVIAKLKEMRNNYNV